MTAEDLYKYIKKLYGVNDAIVCDLHNPCKLNRLCPNSPTHPGLDFDAIKTAFQTGRPGDTPSSTDGITYVGRRFCFVEVKGWLEFLRHLKAKDIDRAIAKKAASYNLEKKLTESREICEIITDDKGLFSEIPVTFVLVTDINTESDGIEMFYSKMFSLALSADNLFDSCNRELKARLDEIPYDIPTVYISCKDFDEKLAQLA